MKIHTKLIIIASLASLFGCASTPPASIGNQPSADPPRMVRDANGNLRWDSASKFGPVPAELQAKGDEICRQGGKRAGLDQNAFTRAIGYHPNALDENGKKIPVGGYYCAR